MTTKFTLKLDYDRFRKGFVDDAKDTLDEAMEYGVDLAKDNAPVRTGALRDSIEILEHAEDDEDGVRGSYGTKIEYGGFVEHGTSRMRAQPFLEPTGESTLSEWQRRLKERRDG